MKTTITLREFVERHGREHNITYSSIYRLIQIGALTENVHYFKSRRERRYRICVYEYELLKYLKGATK